MYSLKGFVGIDGLPSKTPGITSAIGELSPKSSTYAKDYGNYTSPDYPQYSLYSFKSATVSGAINIPAALQAQLWRIIDWAYKYQTASTAATTAVAFVAAMTTRFGAEANSIGCGNLITSGALKFPEYITWINPTLSTNDPSAGGLVKLWFADHSFRNQYDEYEIVVVPPVANVNVFMSTAQAVTAALATYTYANRVNAIQTAKGEFPETILVPRQFDFVDPANPANRITTDWTLIIYGEAGNNIDKIQQAIQNYLLTNSDYNAANWKAVFPDIYSSTEFYMLPRWKNIAIPSLTLQTGAYSSVVNPAKELAYVKAIFDDNPATFIDAHLSVIPTNYNSVELLVLADKSNELSELDIGNIFADLVNVPSSDTLFNMMSSKTRAWVTMIETVLIEAEKATAESTLPAGMSRVVRHNILFIAQEYNGINYLVATKNSTPSY